jgi:membrane protease YdiL (CAAX protease family)
VREPAPTFPLAGGLWAIAGIALSIVVSQTLSAELIDHLWGSPGFWVLGFYLPIYVGVATVCVLVSRHYGTGNLIADFGWRARGSDLWRGPLVWIGAAIASAIVTVPWRHSQTVNRTAHILRHGYQHLGAIATVEFAFFAIVAAPLLEELAFRGLLLRAFSERFDARWAIVLQAVCFGAYHFNPSLGRFNIPNIIGLAVIGAVFGLAATRWRRLGPSLVAHALFNTLFVIATIAAH